MGIIINHYIDTTRIPSKQQWKVRSFFCGSCVLFSVALKKGMGFSMVNPWGCFAFLKSMVQKLARTFCWNSQKRGTKTSGLKEPMKHHPPASLYLETPWKTSTILKPQIDGLVDRCFSEIPIGGDCEPVNLRAVKKFKGVPFGKRSHSCSWNDIPMLNP